MANENVSSSSCEDWKMSRYLSGISIIRFSSFLAWTGLVSSVIFIIVSLDLIFTPLALGLHRRDSDPDYYAALQLTYGLYYGGMTAILVINIGMFIYSFKLWKAISSDNMKKMRSLIKIGCYIMGSLEMLTTAGAGVVTPMFSIIANSIRNISILFIFIIPIIISVVVIAITSLMIHGVRKFKPGLVNMYLIFKIVLFTLFTILTLVQVIMGFIYIGAPGWLLGINQLPLVGFFYFYSSGFMVVQYNIMLGKQAEQRRTARI